MILLVFLRLLFILKMFLQALGFFLAFLAFYKLALDYYQDPLWFLRDFTVFYFSLTTLLIPEIAMGVLLWVCRGAAAVHKRNHLKQVDHLEISVFSRSFTHRVLDFLSSRLCCFWNNWELF